jgi:hypothetical protein
MPTIARAEKGRNFVEIPLPNKGTHQAVCYAVWDIGVHKTEWKGEVKYKHKVIIGWEIEQRIDVPESDYNQKRYVLLKRYNLTLHDKASLMIDLRAWGVNLTQEQQYDGWDLEQLIGLNCYLGVNHDEYKGNNYANISSIIALPPSIQKMKPEIKPTPPPKWVCELMDKQLHKNDFRPDKREATSADEAMKIMDGDVRPEDDLPF